MRVIKEILWAVIIIVLIIAIKFLLPYFLDLGIYKISGGNVCNGVKYDECESGTFKCLENGYVCDGAYVNGEYLSYNDENFCNGDYWPDCGLGRKFICDSINGGICDHDPLKCEEAGRHTCKGTCWDGCPAGYQFICDDVKGGMCQQY